MNTFKKCKSISVLFAGSFVGYFFEITQNTSYKRANLSPSSIVVLSLRGVHLSSPHAENVTFRTRDITPRDARRKQKYIFLLRKMTE